MKVRGKILFMVALATFFLTPCIMQAGSGEIRTVSPQIQYPPRPAGVEWDHVTVAQYSCDIHTPHPYPVDYEQWWTITHAGALAIRIRFSNFQTEYHLYYWYDFAAIYDAEGYYENAYQGDKGTFWSSWVEGDSLSIQFVSDEINTYYGFDIVTYEIAYYNDSDSDHLWDWQEVEVYGTCPTSPDSDGDGLWDDEEVLVHFTNATNPDSDADGVSDGQEINRYRSNATNPNTDGDWWDDGFEVDVLGSDPANFYDPGLWYFVIGFIITFTIGGYIWVVKYNRRPLPDRPVPLLLDPRPASYPARPFEVESSRYDIPRKQELHDRRWGAITSQVMGIQHLPVYVEYQNVVQQLTNAKKALAAPGAMAGSDRPALEKSIRSLAARKAQYERDPALMRAKRKMRELENNLPGYRWDYEDP